MGSYLYEQTSKKFTIHTAPESGLPPVITACEVKYWTKPDWELWDYASGGGYSYARSDWEKRQIRHYRCKLMAHSKKAPSEYVVVADGDAPILFRWQDGKAETIFCDDSSFGITLLKQGVLVRKRGAWCLGDEVEPPRRRTGTRKSKPAKFGL